MGGGGGQRTGVLSEGGDGGGGGGVLPVLLPVPAARSTRGQEAICRVRPKKHAHTHAHTHGHTHVENTFTHKAELGPFFMAPVLYAEGFQIVLWRESEAAMSTRGRAMAGFTSWL